MGVISLSDNEALTPGADLWIVDNPEKYKWALKIDWELNFQILRGQRHTRPTVRPELQFLLDQTGLARTDVSSDSSPLLIAADLNLPCRWVVSLEKWSAAEIQKIWMNLDRPRLRLFSPVEISRSEELSKISKEQDIQVVRESTWID